MNIKIIESQDHIDMVPVIKAYRDIAFYKSISKTLHKNDTIEREIVSKKLSNLRKELSSYATLSFRLEGKNKRTIYWEAFEKKPTLTQIAGFKKAFKDRIAEIRKEQKEERLDEKNTLGFMYNTLGGVFTKKNTILTLAENTDPIQRIRAIKKPMPASINNYVGVEIEMFCSATRESLEVALVQNGLAGFVRVGTDSSIQREGSGHSWELTVLCKQQDAKSTFNKLSKVFNLEYVKAKVNNSCGLHVHVDCRNRDPKKVYNNLVKCLPILTGMVPHERISSEHALRYSKRNTSADYNPTGDRYYMINADAYNKYKTIEVRLHSGTTNPIKIVNWTTLLVAIADAEWISHTVSDVDKLQSITGIPTKLVEYIKLRTELFSSKKIKDTKEDHASSITYEMAV
jgi:hypothetical protein